MRTSVTIAFWNLCNDSECSPWLSSLVRTRWARKRRAVAASDS